MEKKKEKLKPKRLKLRKAAIKEFAKNGVNHTAITSITRRAGVATGTFYSYYDDKESLLQEVLSEHFSEVIAKLRIALERIQFDEKNYSDVPAQAARINDVFTTLLELSLKDQDLFIAWSRYGLGQTQIIDQLIIGYVTQIEKLCGRVMARGDNLPEVDIPILAKCTVSLTFGLAQHMTTLGEPSIEDAATYIMRFTLGGLAGFVGKEGSASRAEQILSYYNDLREQSIKEAEAPEYAAQAS